MNCRLSCALVGVTLMGAFVACNAGDEAGSAGGDDGSQGAGGDESDKGAGGSDAPPEDPDTVFLTDQAGLGGSGSGGGAGGPGGAGGGTQPAFPIPQACLGLELSPPVEFAVAPSDSHSTGSAAYAHELLAGCQAPAPGILETSHFINLHDLGYPRVDGQLGGHLDLLPTEDPTLFIVQGAAVAGADLSRPAVHLTFLVDTSSSTADGAMARQVAALEATKSQLLEGDTIAIYGWSSEAVLERSDGGATSAIQSAIDALPDADLDGALTQGLNAAYASAKGQLGSDGEHTLVVMSDGGESMSNEAAVTLSDIASDAGLSFLGVGVGPAESYSPALLRDMTSIASGKLHFLSSVDGFHAQALFGDGFQRMFGVAARSAVLQVTMPAYFEVVEAPQDIYEGDVSSLRQRTLAPDGTMIFRQTVKACDPEIVNLAIDSMDAIVTFDRPVFGAPDGASAHVVNASVTFPLSIAVNTPNAAANTEALVTFADALRGPVSARLDAATSFIESSSAADAGLRDQLGGLLKRHPNHPTTECGP